MIMSLFAYALAQVDLALSPPRLELNVSPGSVANAQVRLYNDGNEDNISTSFEDFTLFPDGSIVYLPAGSDFYSLCEHMNVLPASLSLQHDENAEVTVQVSMPEDAEGTYHCVVFFETSPRPGEQGGVQVLTTGKIGLIVYATASPQYDAQITEIDATAESVRLVVENYGNALMRPSGSLQILNAAGEQVERVEISSFPLLRDGFRELELAMPELDPGRYVVFASLQYRSVRLAAEGVVDVP